MARAGDCERIIQWVNDARSGYTETAEETLSQAIDRAQAAELRASKAEADKARLDWLEHHLVEVREPLVNGSLHLFFASPDDSFEGEEGPSDLRAKIDAAIHQAGGADAQS
jgi:flagellar basal body-associated protein FliL